MRLNYHDAFIPIITIGKKQNNTLISKQFFVQKQPSKKYVSFRNFPRQGKNFLCMNIFSNYKLNAFEIIRDDIEKNDSNWKSSIQRLPSSYRRVISLLIFGSFFLSGWFLTPSKNRYVSLGISIVSGGLAFVLSNKIDSKNSSVVKSKILEKIVSYSENPNLKKEINKIDLDLNINSEDLKNEIIDVYKRYIQVFLRDSEIRVEEILELIKIKNIFNISSQDVGECHIQIARDLYKEYTIDLERKFSDNPSDKVDKFLFLSDRIFSLDSAKGYQYESSRIRKVFMLPNEKVANTCLSISNSLYKKIIELSFEEKLYNLEDLEAFQNVLGIKGTDKEKIHSDFLKNKISIILSKDKKISENEQLELHKIANVFKIEDFEFKKIIFKQTQTFFQLDIIDILVKCSDKLDLKDLKKLSELLLRRKSDLVIPSSEIKHEISVALRKVTENIISTIINNMRFQKTKLVIDGIESLFNLQENSLNIFQSLGLFNKEDIDFIYSNDSYYGANINFKIQDLKQILIVFIQSSLNNFSIDLINEEKIFKLKKIFSISDQDYDVIYNGIAEPIYINQANNFVQDKNFSVSAIAELANLQNSLKINQNSILFIKINIYKNCLLKCIEQENILSVESLNNLNQIRMFFSLKWSDVQQVHDSANEMSYVKAISEAMGASGFISKSYWDGLEKLRKRLYITEKKAREIFYRVSQDKLKQLFEQAVIENKRKTQLKSEGKDSKEEFINSNNSGTALGIEAGNASGNELSNLIDFYVRNKILIEKEIPVNNSSNLILKGMNGRIETKLVLKTKKEYIYPININGLFDKKLVSEMYKQYLVECFSSKLQNEKRKMFSNLDKLGPILGIDNLEIDSIHSSVGALVYKQFLAQALQKGYIDKSETAFLTSIQNTLTMDNKICSDLIKDAKKNRIAFFIENIFSKPKINPESVSEMREMASRLGVNLQNDLLISSDQCSKLFRVEIDSNIEKGVITSENQTLVEEIRLAFGLSKETVKKVLLESITSRCEGHLINAVASLRKNLLEESLKEIEKLLSFGNLLPVKMQSTFASKKEKEQLLSLFQSMYEQNQDNTNKQNMIDLLKLMLNI